MKEKENIDGKKIRVSGKLYTLSNAVSFSRLFMAFPIVWLTNRNGGVPDVWVTLLLIYTILSDYLDGHLARRLNEVSELGKLLDPVSDKLTALVLFLYAFWLGRIPSWFLWTAIARDLFIMGGSALIRHRTGKLAMAVMSGKVSVNLLSMYWLSVFFLPAEEGLHLVMLTITTVAMAISFLDYAYRTFKILNGSDFN